MLITADGFYRRGKVVPMKETADAAAAQAPTVEHMLVVRRIGREVAWHAGPRPLVARDRAGAVGGVCDAR